MTDIQDMTEINTIFDDIRTATVTKTSWRKVPKKFIFLQTESGDTLPSLSLPRSACVSKGDILQFDDGYVHVRCENGLAQLLPIYSVEDSVRIGQLILPVRVKEITEIEEYNAYVNLTQYHYRGKSLFGRHATLVICVEHPLLPPVAGYIELSSAFLVCTPRRHFFNVPCKLDSVSWESWDLDTAKKYTSLFARIARCVVHPELRGAGVGQILVKHAAEFAKSHWQSGGWRPYILEISADMLRYIPFAEKAGMFYIGETEGNLHRIVKDLDYLIRNKERMQNKEILSDKPCGIVDAKLSQYRAALETDRLKESQASDLDASHVDATLKRLLADIAHQIQQPTLKGYAELKDVLVFPKPVHIKGLHPDATEFIQRRISELSLLRKNMKNSDLLKLFLNSEPIDDSIRFGNTSVELTYQVYRTKLTHEIEKAFSIPLDTLVEPVFKGINLSIDPGEIWMVTGISGTGKSTFLRLLAGNISPASGTLSIPANAKIAELEPIRSKRPLIEVFSAGDVRRGLSLLNSVGLSEAFLYVKPYQVLSSGQKYRAMLAYLISKNSNLWLIDDFCENLDPITSNLIAKNLSKLANKCQITVILTAADYSRFLNALKPDKILLLTGDTEYKIFTFEQFQNWVVGSGALKSDCDKCQS